MTVTNELLLCTVYVSKLFYLLMEKKFPGKTGLVLAGIDLILPGTFRLNSQPIGVQ